MEFYEHTLIAKQDLSSAEIEKVQSKYNDIINGTSGKVVKIEKWGLLNFARKIRNYNYSYQDNISIFAFRKFVIIFFSNIKFT